MLVYTSSGNKYFDFNNQDDVTYNGIVELINEFHIVESVGACADAVYSEKTKNALETLVAEYGGKCKILKSLEQLLSRLHDNEKFCILQYEAQGMEKYKAQAWVQSYPKEISRIMTTNRITKQWMAIDCRYCHYVFGHDGIKVFVGANHTGTRSCRFCGKSEPEVEFKKKNAHAIPEALGNKLLFSNEECKGCNERLSVVEKDLITMMDFRRSMYGIRPKGQNKPIDCIGEDFVVRWNKEGERLVYVKRSVLEKANIINNKCIFTIHHREKLTHNNIYKALVKMVIDVVPSSELSHFTQTIEWINGKLLQDVSPHYLTTYCKCVFQQPILDIFINKPETKGPYCTAMLRVCDMIYLFIIPLVDVDKGLYKHTQCLYDHYKSFTEIFQGQWEYVDSSEMTYSVPWFKMTYGKDICIKDDEDQIFDLCKSPRNEPYGFIHFPEFDRSKIKESHFKLYYCHITPNLNLTYEDLVDANIVSSERLIYLDLHESKFVLTTEIEVSSSNKKKVMYSCKFGLTFNVEDIEKYYVCSEEGFTVCGNLCRYMITRLHYVGENVVKSHRLGTKVERCSLDTIASMTGYESIFDLRIIGKLNCIKPATPIV